MRIVGLAAIFALLALSAPAAERSAHAAPFTVTRTDDPPPDACQPADCSLREAIIAANAAAGADTITLAAGVYQLSIANDDPGVDEDGALTGDLDIVDTLTIIGADATTTIIDADGLDRVVHILPNAGMTIDSVTIRDGLHGGGAGIYNQGTLLVHNSIVSENTQEEVGAGGGILNDVDADLTVRDSAINLNSSWQIGTAVANSDGGAMLLERVTISGNTSPFEPHAVFNQGTATIRDSQIKDNPVGAVHNVGAGTSMTVERTIVHNNGLTPLGTILNDDPASLTVLESSISQNTGFLGLLSGGPLLIDRSAIVGNAYGGVGTMAGGTGPKQIHNSTISGNDGPGLYAGSSVDLNNVTITNNSTPQGGGILIENGGSVDASNSVIAGNTDTSGGEAPDCSGTINSLGHLLIGDLGGCIITGDTTGNLTDVDPQLGPLLGNGAISVHPPLIGSPLINAGSPLTPGSAPGACETVDQRGRARPQSGRCDIGAFEVSDADADNDGCANAEEAGDMPNRGGQRNAQSPWDFFDVPVPASGTGADGKPILGPGSVRNKAITLHDVGVVLSYVGRSGANPAYTADNNSDGIADGTQLDRLPSIDPEKPWQSTIGNAAISLQDVGVVLAQVGHSCLPAP